MSASMDFYLAILVHWDSVVCLQTHRAATEGRESAHKLNWMKKTSPNPHFTSDITALVEHRILISTLGLDVHDLSHKSVIQLHKCHIVRGAWRQWVTDRKTCLAWPVTQSRQNVKENWQILGCNSSNAIRKRIAQLMQQCSESELLILFRVCKRNSTATETSQFSHLLLRRLVRTGANNYDFTDKSNFPVFFHHRKLCSGVLWWCGYAAAPQLCKTERKNIITIHLHCAQCTETELTPSSYKICQVGPRRSSVTR